MNNPNYKLCSASESDEYKDDLNQEEEDYME